jgi:HNH endonuclease
VTPLQAILPFALEWRLIPGFPEYEVREDGEIRRAKSDKRGLGMGHILKSWVYSEYGHRQIKLFNSEHKLRFICIHQAVALAFIGPKPPDKDEVAHNDGVAWHNHWSNLRWATHAENHEDKNLHGTNLVGERNPTARLSNSQVKEIKQRLAGGAKQKDLAAHFGVHKCTIQAIAAGRNWKETA